jgi:hypothetical protein
LKQLERHFHPSERRPELVTDVEQQLIPGSDHVSHPTNHLIEGLGQPPELIARSGGHDDVQLSSAEAIHAIAQRSQWLQQSVQYAVSAEHDGGHDEQKDDEDDGMRGVL